MSVNYKPESYSTITPYLSVNGAAELIDFLGTVFGGVCTERMDEGCLVMHAEVRIDGAMLMLADACEKLPAYTTGLYIYVPDVDATFAKAIAAGATADGKPTDQFYGDRSGGFVDKWGNRWWVATHKEDVSPEEMQQRVEEWKQKAAESAQ